MQIDIRDHIFRNLDQNIFRASLIASEDGIVAGQKAFIPRAERLGLDYKILKEEGAKIFRAEPVLQLKGTAKQIGLAEERLIGWILKASGIATAASSAKRLAGGRFEVISGGWKKMPFELKEPIQQAIHDGGVNLRMCDEPFVYLDKNYVRMLGGVRKAVEAAGVFNRMIVIQIRGETRAIAEEAIEATHAGAHVVMVDTGSTDHLRSVGHTLKQSGLRSQVKIAFAGNIKLDDLEALAQFDLDVVDIGYAILDAPCLPMRFDVVGVT